MKKSRPFYECNFHLLMKTFKVKRIALFLFGVIFLQTLAYSSYAQKSISGTVTDEAGTPLPGVTIIIKGTTNGTVTNMDGNYAINNIPDGATLAFSFVGMLTQEIEIGDKTVIDVTLKTSTVGLDDVVVIGYGTVKKGDLTGAVSVVGSDVLENRVNQSVDHALRGRIAGLRITSSDGAPGGGTRVRIRGTSTISGSGDPLYVIDGVPITTDGSSDSYNGSTEGNPMSYINPDDIESVQVLKDASATAIYGSRATNGVIILKTKTGAKEKSKYTVSFNAKYGVATQAKYYDMMETSDYALHNFYQSYGNKDSKYWPEDNLANWADTTNTNWQKELGQTGMLQDYNLSVRGQDNNTTYSVSLGYFDQSGVLIASDFSRTSALLNLTQKLNDRIKLITNINYSQTEKNGLFAGMNGFGLLNQNLRFPPYYSPYNEKGDLELLDGVGDMIANPLLQARDTKKNDMQNRLVGKIGLDIKLAKGLTFSPSIAINHLHSSLDVFWPKTSNLGLIFNGQAIKNYSNNKQWVQDNVLTYIKSFNKHNTNFMVGTSIEKNVSNFFQASASDFPIPVLNTDFMGSAIIGSVPGSSVSEFQLVSGFSRADYNFDQKYYLTATIRADGSSRFGEDSKWGFFPSAAFRWRASRENFLKNVNAISDLSFRLSYGKTGNQAIPSYQTLGAALSVKTYYSDQGVMALIPVRNANPELKWENTDQYDAGMNLGMFNNRVMLEADVYYKKTNDMLLNRPLPSYTGFSSKMDNIGSIENKGLEIALKTANIDRDFKWNTSFNIAFNRNKVLDLGGPDKLIMDINFDFRMKDELILQKGQPIGQWYGYVRDGLFSSWDEIHNGTITNQFGYVREDGEKWDPASKRIIPGTTKYKDLSGPGGVPDGIIDSYDRTVLGCGVPDFTGGISNDFEYKGLTLDVLFTFSYGSENLNATYADLTHSQLNYNKVKDLNDFFRAEMVGEEWVFSNTDAQFPNPKIAERVETNSLFISDASFIRLANVVLGYQLPSKWVRKAGFKGAKLFATGDNLYIWTNYNGYDPEATTGQGFTTGGTSKNLAPGLDAASYPASRSVSFGINVTF